MNLNQQLWLKSLDPDQMYGTIQRVLMEENLSVIPFEAVAKHLITVMMQERETMLKENNIMRKELVKHGLYTSELLQLEG
ncbi:hypothetical protein [Pseudomonas phage vB_PsaM_M1]|nr:hypothetical protein [Pseudomonas phage vB_PsaM_M1]